MLYISWVIIVLFICYSLNDEIILKKYELQSNKVNNEIRILQISDFHNYNAKILISNLKKIDFDIVVITGDLIDQRFDLKQVTILLNYLKDFNTYFVSGNHEIKQNMYFDDINQMYTFIKGYGVTIIDNENVDICINDNNISLIGIIDNTYYDRNIRYDAEAKQVFKQCSCLACNYNIVLMHRPERFELFIGTGCDLILSGHTHGGQVRFGCLVNGLYAPGQGYFPKRAGGKYINDNFVHIVNRGLARFRYLPRIFNRCEICLITINKKS